MGYMFNKQLRGYNTEEVDDTIETLEKKIQETTLQIRRLEKELDKVKKENIAMANRQSVERKTNEEISRLALKEASELITKAKHNANMILKESMNYVKGLSDEVEGFKDEAKDFRTEIVKISTELLETIDKSEIFSLINEEEKKRRKRALIKRTYREAVGGGNGEGVLVRNHSGAAS